jgi:t-SNARE complex subunit (syntaxin)
LEEVRRRAEGIRQIERDVTELNEMFQDLQTLVVAQQETFDSIENNIIDAKDQVVTGNEELVKVSRRQNAFFFF